MYCASVFHCSALLAKASKFNKARRFIEGVLRSKEEERFSLRRCQKEARNLVRAYNQRARRMTFEYVTCTSSRSIRVIASDSARRERNIRA